MNNFFDPYIPGACEFHVSNTRVIDTVAPPNASNQVVSGTAPFAVECDIERDGFMSEYLVGTALANGRNAVITVTAVNIGTDPTVQAGQISLSPGNPTLTNETITASIPIDPVACGMFSADPAAGHSGVYDLTKTYYLDTGHTGSIKKVIGSSPSFRVHLR